DLLPGARVVAQLLKKRVRRSVARARVGLGVPVRVPSVRRRKLVSLAMGARRAGATAARVQDAGSHVGNVDNGVEVMGKFTKGDAVPLAAAFGPGVEHAYQRAVERSIAVHTGDHDDVQSPRNLPDPKRPAALEQLAQPGNGVRLGSLDGESPRSSERIHVVRL